VARRGSTRLQQLQRDGGIVNIQGEQAGVRILDALDEQTAYDLVLITLLAFQIEAVLPVLRRSAAQCLQFMFNIFEPERLQEAVGAERCSFGMPFVQANFAQDGKLKATIGANGQKNIMSQARWVDVFNAAGLPAVLEPDMPLWLRCHAPALSRVSSFRELLATGKNECCALVDVMVAAAPRANPPVEVARIKAMKPS
jgi:2-dehydropantoate 2-reductase